jgi:hypothetical protein
MSCNPFLNGIKAFATSIDNTLEDDLFKGTHRGVCWRVLGLETAGDGSPLPPPLSEQDSLKELSGPAASLIGATTLKFKLFDTLLSVVCPSSTVDHFQRAGTGVINFNDKLNKVGGSLG